MHPQFLRQRHNVVALLQAGDGVLLERLWKFAHTFLGHLPPPSWCPVCQFAVSQSRGSVQDGALIETHAFNTTSGFISVETGKLGLFSEWQTSIPSRFG